MDIPFGALFHFETLLVATTFLEQPLRKSEGRFAKCFLEKLLMDDKGSQLNDRISNSRLYEKRGSIPFSRAIMKETLRWVKHVLRMKDDRLPKVFGQPSRAKRKAGHPRLRWEDVIKKDLKEIGTSWEGVKREALNILR